jgi:hypothetical protein
MKPPEQNGLMLQPLACTPFFVLDRTHAVARRPAGSDSEGIVGAGPPFRSPTARKNREISLQKSRHSRAAKPRNSETKVLTARRIALSE